MRARSMGRRGSGFTLVELVVVLVVLSGVVVVGGPALTGARSSAQGVSSTMRLGVIGQNAGMYGADNGDAIFSFGWRPFEEYIDLRDGDVIVPLTDQEAAAFEVRDILYRATGRFGAPGRIMAPVQQLMQLRYSHLVLADYMGGNVSDEIWVDPADERLLDWQGDPLRYLRDGCEEENPVPYQYHCEVPGPGYDYSVAWRFGPMRMMWCFGSSYLVAPAAYLYENGARVVPVSATPHVFSNRYVRWGVKQRSLTEVRHPGMKVWMYEEFDRELARDTYFAYDHARPAKLMFDGSVDESISGDARSSVSPSFDEYEGTREPEREGEFVWTQRYVPLDRFPEPLSGLGEETLLDMRYRWTWGGLQGIDYVRLITGNGR